jgi:hypothetical protein
MGHFDLSIFKNSEDFHEIGKFYSIAMVITFHMLLMNLLVAILANTYNSYDSKSNGLYLSKILSTRDELQYDESYGAFFCSMPPVSIIQIPFVPIAVFLSYGHPLLVKINDFIMKVQYVIFMCIVSIVFLFVSIILIPFAWLIGISDKLKLLDEYQTKADLFLNIGVFIPFGPFIMLLNTLVDFVYFWINNFKNDL